MRLTEPQLFKTEAEFPEEYLVPALKKEMDSKRKFDVYDEVPLSECTLDEINGALPTKWVKTWKTADTVRARVVVMGCFQEQIDPDVLYANTPTLVTMRILLLMAIARNWTIKLLDVSTAFFTFSYARHCFDRTAERVLPKPRLSPWKLKKAMYGLKQPPALWQSHFQSVMAELGMKGFKTDANLYCHESRSLYVLCYVDDILACGDDPLIDEFITTLSEEVLPKLKVT